jgi:hypothetical protein
MKTFAIYTNTSNYGVMIESECANPTEVLQWVIDQPSVNERSPYFFALNDINGKPVLMSAAFISEIREL